MFALAEKRPTTAPSFLSYDEVAKKELEELMDLWSPSEFQPKQERFKEIIQANPILAQATFGWEKQFPLHQAATFSSSLSVVEAVFEAYPDGVKRGDENRWRPLHLAWQHNQSEQVIRFLEDKDPDAGDVLFYVLGRLTPLHLACRHNQSEQVIRSLVNRGGSVYSVWLMVKDCDGSTPLHDACDNKSEQLIRFLVPAADSPHPLQERDMHGQMPLHRACSNNPSEQVIRFLVEQFPQALKERTEYGQTPLHRACRYSQSEQVIRFLVEQYPQAVTEKDKYDKVPLDYARENNAASDTIDLLTNPEQALQPNKRKSLCADNDAHAPRVPDAVESSLQAPKRPKVEPRDPQPVTPPIHQHAAVTGRAVVDAGAAAVATAPAAVALLPPPQQRNNENDVTSTTWAPTANLPLYQEATSSRVIVDDLWNVTARISKQLITLEVKATYFNQTATARLETPENVIMHLALWRTSDHPDGILVELQLREGRAESFHIYSRLILNAATGESAPAKLG